MKMIRRIALLAALTFTLGLVAPGWASAAPYDGTDPIATGCANSAITARSAYGDIPGRRILFVELRYSRTCKTAWARMTTMNMPNCQLGVDFCGHVNVVRTSDGLSFRCDLQNGTHGCYTRQVNDNGVTSYATGVAHMGGWSTSATTGAYLSAGGMP